MSKKTLNIDLNRVEGDLEFELDVEEGVVVDARCKGIMYRGFEQLLIDRAPKDSIVLTPRVCGICGTAHMYCAVLALESIWNVEVPANATRIRNLCLMAENLQSDLRQSFLMFTPDFCNQKYANEDWFEDAKAAFEPFHGKVHRGILDQTKRILEIVAIWGGQWPHSSYMVPGGVTLGPEIRRIIDSLEIVDKQIQYFEDKIIGGDIEAWQAIETKNDLLQWFESDERKSNSAIGLYSRFGRAIGLHKIGVGTEHMICYGGYHLADSWSPLRNKVNHSIPSGYFNPGTGVVEAFDQKHIEEHVKYSWYRDYEGGRHPYEGETIPAYLPETDKYTWAKAPRYKGQVAQTGPLAEYMVMKHPLIMDLYKSEGGNTWLRQFARMRRVSDSLLGLRKILEELKQHIDEPFLTPESSFEEVDGEGFGLVQAARGSLGHWVKVKDGKIEKYQIVTPTAWNASPRDSEGQHGHWEQSVIGMTLDDPENPVQIGHVVRSHDPCLVCTVHMVGDKNGEMSRRFRYGV